MQVDDSLYGYNECMRKAHGLAHLNEPGGGPSADDASLMTVVTTSTAVEIGAQRAAQIERSLSHPSAKEEAFLRGLMQRFASIREESR